MPCTFEIGSFQRPVVGTVKSKWASHRTHKQVANLICQNGHTFEVGNTNSLWTFAKLLTTCDD